MVDSNGNSTVTRHYCDLYVEKLLKNIEKVPIVYSPSQQCFISANKEQQVDQLFYESYINYNGKFSNDSFLKFWLIFYLIKIFLELVALSELVGIIGSKYILEQVNSLIYENMIKIKAVTTQNKEVLQSLRINFDRPDMMRDLYRRLESNFHLYFSCI